MSEQFVRLISCDAASCRSYTQLASPTDLADVDVALVKRGWAVVCVEDHIDDKHYCPAHAFLAKRKPEPQVTE